MRRFLYWLMFAGLIALVFGIFFFFFIAKDPVSRTYTFTLPKNPFGLAGDVSQGTGSGSTSTSTDQGQYGTSTPTNPQAQLLTKVWNKPVAGFSFVDIPYLLQATSTDKKGNPITIQIKATSSYLYFVEKETGNVYRRNLTTGTTTRLTNTTIPGVYDAYFVANGSYVAMRTYTQKQGIIKTFISKLPDTIVSDPLPLGQTTFFQDNLISMVVSPLSDLLYYLAPGSDGSNLYTWTPSKGVSFVSSYPLKELLLNAYSSGVVITTKASAFVKGYVLSSSFTNIYGGKTGLTTNISPSGSLLFSSMWSNSGLVTFIHSLVTGNDVVIKAKTLAEKCVWDSTTSFALCGGQDYSPREVYGFPDDWYQGQVHFQDALYLIGIKIPTESKIFDFTSTAGEPIDMISPVLNRTSTLLGFLNYNNGILWLLDVKSVLHPENATSSGSSL